MLDFIKSEWKLLVFACITVLAIWSLENGNVYAKLLSLSETLDLTAFVACVFFASFIFTALLLPFTGAIQVATAMVSGYWALLASTVPILIASIILVNTPLLTVFKARQSKQQTSILPRVSLQSQFLTLLLVRLSSTMPISVTNILTYRSSLSPLLKTLVVLLGTGAPSLLIVVLTVEVRNVSGWLILEIMGNNAPSQANLLFLAAAGITIVVLMVFVRFVSGSLKIPRLARFIKILNLKNLFRR